MKKRISLAEVRPGMFLEDVYDSNGTLLLSANQPVTGQSQIESLRNRGVASVFINLEKGLDVGSSQSSITQIPEEQLLLESKERAAAYFKELERAKEIHIETIDCTIDVLKAVRSGATFSASKVRNTAENMAKSLERNSEALVSLTQIKGFDEYTYTHSVNVGVLLMSLAGEFGYKGDKLVEVGVGGLLHDIGKMKVPESILNKPGKLTDAEFTLIKRHPEFGNEIIGNKQNITELSRKVILQHHERFDGSGYPLRLAGLRIHEIGLMGAVVDVYDALTSDRVYKSAWTPQQALATIFQGCDAEYSRKVVEQFTKHLGVYPAGSFVRLKSGEMGFVTRVDHNNLLTPLVIVLFDRNGKRLAKPLEYDLRLKQTGSEGELYRVEVSLNPKLYGVDIKNYL